MCSAAPCSSGRPGDPRPITVDDYNLIAFVYLRNTYITDTLSDKENSCCGDLLCVATGIQGSPGIQHWLDAIEYRKDIVAPEKRTAVFSTATELKKRDATCNREKAEKAAPVLGQFSPVPINKSLTQ